MKVTEVDGDEQPTSPSPESKVTRTSTAESKSKAPTSSVDSERQSESPAEKMTLPRMPGTVTVGEPTPASRTDGHHPAQEEAT